MAERIIDTLITVFGFRTERTQLENVRRNIQTVRKSLDGLARNLAVAGAAASATLFGVGRTLLDYEAAQNRLAATFLDAPVEQLGELRQQSLDLGSSTSKSAQEAANAQLELARAGLSLNEVLAATPDVLNLAIAGELEMGEAAALVTSQLNSFSLEVEHTQRVTDLLAAAQSMFSTSVREMGPALRQVSALAASAGLSIEQTTAAIGTLRSGGLRAEQAGTALRGILARLLDVNPPTEMAATLDRMGVSLAELQAQIAVGDLSGVMHRLAEAGLDTSAAIQIFGVEAAQAATILAGRAGDLAVFEEELLAVGGTADDMRQIMERGLPGAISRLQASVEGLALGLGGEGGVTSALTGLIENLTEFVNWLNQSSWWTRTLGQALIIGAPLLIGLGLAVKGVSIALGGYSIAVTGAIALTGWWRRASMTLRLQLLALELQTRATAAAARIYRGALALTRLSLLGAAKATWAFTIALLANPITWVVIGIAALIAAIVLLIIYWDRVRDVAVAVWQTIWSAIKGVWDWVSQNWPLLLAILGGPFTAVGYLVYRFRDTIVGVIKGVWDWISGLVDRLVGWIDTVAQKAQEVYSKIAFWRGDDSGGAGREARGATGSVQSGSAQPAGRRSTGRPRPGATPSAGSGSGQGIGAERIGAGSSSTPVAAGREAQSPGVPQFERGGIVPGRRGDSVLSRLHGGEMVLPEPVAVFIQRLAGREIASGGSAGQPGTAGAVGAAGLGVGVGGSAGQAGAAGRSGAAGLGIGQAGRNGKPGAAGTSGTAGTSVRIFADRLRVIAGQVIALPSGVNRAERFSSLANSENTTVSRASAEMRSESRFFSAASTAVSNRMRTAVDRWRETVIALAPPAVTQVARQRQAAALAHATALGGAAGQPGRAGLPGAAGQSGQPGFGGVGLPGQAGRANAAAMAIGIGQPGRAGLTGVPGAAGFGGVGLPGQAGLPGQPGVAGQSTAASIAFGGAAGQSGQPGRAGLPGLTADLASTIAASNTIRHLTTLASLPSFQPTPLPTPPPLSVALPGGLARSMEPRSNDGNGADRQRTVNATIALENITLQIERGDPDEIAAQVGASLQAQLQDVAEDFASRVRL